MGGKTATSTNNGTSNGSSTTTLSSGVQSAYDALLKQFGGLASGTNSTTDAATGGLGSLAANSNANFGSAANTLNGAAGPASASIGDYLSPYLTGALQTQIASQNQQNAQQQQGVIGNAAAQGALGGNRVGVAQGILAGQQSLANNQANTGLINNAYQQAANSALQGQANQISAGNAQAGLGSSQTNSSLSSLLGLLSAGNSQFSNLGGLSGAANTLSNDGATTTSSGTTTGTSTQPNGNIFSQLLGAGLGIAGLFQAGGVVPHLANGGDSGASDRGMALAAAMSAAQQAGAPPQNDNQQTGANDNGGLGGIASQAQMKQGVSNLKGWLTPAVSSGVAGGSLNGVYAHGGVVARGYDVGGYVQPPDSFYSGLLDQITREPAPSAPVSAGVVPVAVASAPAPSDNVVPFPSQGAGLVPPTPTFDQSMLKPQPAPDVPVPLAPLPAQGLVPSPNPSPNVSRSDRNNNPGNIVASPWTANQPGFAGTDGRFAVFNSPEAGQQAMTSLLGHYQASGHNTISSIVNKWAPPSDNNPTGSYINYVSSRTGIDPTQPLAPGQIPVVANAMSEFESGHRGGSTSPAANAVNAEAGAPAGVVSAPSALAFNSGAQGVIPNPGTSTGQPGGGIPGGLGVTPPGGYGVPDSNAGYSTNLGDVFKSLQAGKGLNLSPDARMGLLSAAAGMMGGTNGNGLINIGQGVQQGIKTWQDKQKLNNETATANSDIGYSQGMLGLEGKRTDIAGQQLYLDAQRAASEIAQRGVDTAATRYPVANSPYGPMYRDVTKPDAGATLAPWNFPAAAGVQSAGAVDTAPLPRDDAGFVTGAPPMDMSHVNPVMMTDEGRKTLWDQSQGIVDPAKAQAVNSQALNVQLGQLSDLSKNLPASGPLTQGAGFNDRVGVVNGLNTALSAFGIKPVDPDSVATAEDLKKMATQLQFAVADQVKSDPAASTIVQAGGASPSGENTAQGFRRIVGNLEATNKRSIDRATFLQDWRNQHYGDMTGSDETFNKLNPPDKYIAYGKTLADQLGGNSVVSTQAQYDALAPGSVYTAPDGKQHRKQ